MIAKNLDVQGPEKIIGNVPSNAIDIVDKPRPVLHFE